MRTDKHFKFFRNSLLPRRGNGSRGSTYLAHSLAYGHTLGRATWCNNLSATISLLRCLRLLLLQRCDFLSHQMKVRAVCKVISQRLIQQLTDLTSLRSISCDEHGSTISRARAKNAATLCIFVLHKPATISAVDQPACAQREVCVRDLYQVVLYATPFASVLARSGKSFSRSCRRAARSFFGQTL